MRALLACVATLLACGSMGSPSGVADKFVDKYYVEADQAAALLLADGVAALRLKSELGLVGDSRRGIAQGTHAARVFYQRTRLAGDGAARQADYSLRIRPQGTTGEIVRDAHLELAQQKDGTWRVTRFSETTPR